MKKMEIIALIPARGGSKGLPRKNIRLLTGKPLIAYSIETALKSKWLDKVVVSTEDEEIAKVSKEYGAEVIERPEELARDETPTIDVVFHVLDFLKTNDYTPDIVILLQPTSPLRTVEDIDGAIELFFKKDCESVISVYEAEHPPHWCFKVEKGYLKNLFEEKYWKMRRQDLPNAYSANGAIFVTTPAVLYKHCDFYTAKTIPYIMPIERSIDMDNEIDFMMAELLLKRYGLAEIK